MNDKICKGRKCFIVSMLFMLTFFFSIGFMEQSSKADTVNYSEGDFSYQLTQETKTATLQKYTGISQSVTIPSRIDGILGVNVKPCTIAAVKLPHKIQQHQPDGRPDKNLIHGRSGRKVPLECVHIAAQRTEYRCGCQIQQIHYLRCQPIHNAI